jgi:hypothetical protein
MLMERREVVEARKQAARQWLEAFAEKMRNGDQPTAKTDRALVVIVLDHRTSDWLAEHDPQALKQAQEALSGESWAKYHDRQPPPSRTKGGGEQTRTPEHPQMIYQHCIDDINEEIASGYRTATVPVGGLSGSGSVTVVPGQTRLAHNTHGPGTVTKVEIDDIPRFPAFTVRLDDGQTVTARRHNFKYLGGGGTPVPESEHTDGAWTFDHHRRTFERHLYDHGFPFTETHARKYEGRHCQVDTTTGSRLTGTVTTADPTCLRVGRHVVPFVLVAQVKVYYQNPR